MLQKKNTKKTLPFHFYTNIYESHAHGIFEE